MFYPKMAAPYKNVIAQKLHIDINVLGKHYQVRTPL